MKSNTVAYTKQPWQPMKLTVVGHIGQIVQGGGGKLSTVGGDPGDIRKPRGQEGK